MIQETYLLLNNLRNHYVLRRQIPSLDKKREDIYLLFFLCYNNSIIFWEAIDEIYKDARAGE